MVWHSELWLSSLLLDLGTSALAALAFARKLDMKSLAALTIRKRCGFGIMKNVPRSTLILEIIPF